MINSIKQGKFAMLAFAQQKKAINWNQTMFLQPNLTACVVSSQSKVHSVAAVKSSKTFSIYVAS